MNWHPDETLVASYASGRLEWSKAVSLEAHIVSCAPCRESLVSRVRNDAIDRVWTGVVAETATRLSLMERALTRLSVPQHVARLVAATPSLSASWLLAVAVALGFAVAAAHAGGAGHTLYIAVAPLVPLAGVAAAYGPGIDPAYEIGMAAPMRSQRLLLLRAAAVLGVSVALAAVASLFLPRGMGVVLWLVPAIAMTALGLAFGSVSSPLRAGAAVAFAWVLFVAVAAGITDDALRAARGDVQMVLAVIAIAAGLVVWARRDWYETRRSR